MNLKEIRTKLVEISGRADLVESYSSMEDAGADFYIQAGSKLLDQLADITESVASRFVNIAEGDFYVTFDLCRAIHEVWVYANGGRAKLVKADSAQLKAMFPQLLINSSKGIPAYYLPINVRIADGSDTPPVGYLNYVNITGEEVDGILFPPCDQDAVLEIVGRFYSAPLVNNNSKNYWSSNHPMLLVWAALYCLEVSYRNTEGARDWYNSITLNLDSLFKDKVEQESQDLTQLGGKEND